MLHKCKFPDDGQIKCTTLHCIRLSLASECNGNIPCDNDKVPHTTDLYCQNLKYFIFQLTHKTYKILRLLK